MSDTKYIYEGKRIDVWEDEKYVTLALALTTIGIPKKYWDKVKEDIIELAKVLEKNKG